ncbi:D-alanyl-D-alanine carboxypeptidase [Pokkaliibacter sp. MBI-7]|uniref:D-alanyl-D-alanine carboxypeptidase/D-alanyl-D-alanine-endopeptidase n=1 Tax=Pokkaliibacter sp. MBI-7 TaxID=3040600 RepID=UPI00244960BC|nr:D-alanyl-D-alanine carboxypeptidase [Pokkaliibacter sp. MBI-7]MDH2435073.1 D-alanyl-D-alanine carboxypeptidase [Pokkaliibacter sp. MBI-7]
MRFLVLALALTTATTSYASNLQLPANASLWVEGHKELSKNSTLPRAPASTLKVLTALYAIDTLGLDYHFKTPLWIDKNGMLWVEGQGDPSITSETLEAMADYVKSRNIAQISGIGVDSSYYASNQIPDGISETANPYDAMPAALILNYNTIFIKRVNGKILSAEPQTPLTPTALFYAAKLQGNQERINLGNNPVDFQTYFAEQLRAQLEKKGITVRNLIKIAKTPANAHPIGNFENPKTLRDVLQDMLYYSNNIIANQLFLTLGAMQQGRPSTLEKSQLAMTNFVDEHFKWQQFHIEEGSGLSRKNHISAAQLGELLETFRPYQSLLKEFSPELQAKTGTLSDVSALAGYVKVNDQWVRFALMMDHSGAPGLRFSLANALRQQLAHSAPVKKKEQVAKATALKESSKLNKDLDKKESLAALPN